MLLSLYTFFLYLKVKNMEQKTFEKLKKKFEKINHSTTKKINNKHFFEDKKKTIEGLDILHNTIQLLSLYRDVLFMFNAALTGLGCRLGPENMLMSYCFFDCCYSVFLNGLSVETKLFY